MTPSKRRRSGWNLESTMKRSLYGRSHLLEQLWVFLSSPNELIIQILQLWKIDLS